MRVPQYHDVTLGTNATLKPSPWVNALGGFLAFKANGTVNVGTGAQISATGLGYAGGAGGTGGNGGQRHGFQGEGSGTSASSQAKEANASSGGAGQADLISGDGAGGGGGGSHATVGTNGTINSIHPLQDFGRGSTNIVGNASCKYRDALWWRWWWRWR